MSRKQAVDSTSTKKFSWVKKSTNYPRRRKCAGCGEIFYCRHHRDVNYKCHPSGSHTPCYCPLCIQGSKELENLRKCFGILEGSKVHELIKDWKKIVKRLKPRRRSP